MITDPLELVPKDWRLVRYAVAAGVVLIVSITALEYPIRCLESIAKHWPF